MLAMHDKYLDVHVEHFKGSCHVKFEAPSLCEEGKMADTVYVYEII